MGYRIMYDKYGKARHYKTRKSRLSKSLTAAICLVLSVAILSLTGLGKWIRSFIMPGVSDAAFTVLVEDLRSGESITDAVSAFCAGVVDNAQLGE